MFYKKRQDSVIEPLPIFFIRMHGITIPLFRNAFLSSCLCRHFAYDGGNVSHIDLAVAIDIGI